MSSFVCPYCDSKLEKESDFCPVCGAPLREGAQAAPSGECDQAQSGASDSSDTQSAAYSTNNSSTGIPDDIDPNWPVKSKTAAGILGILLGGIGVHKFYLGKIGLGIVYVLLCWTGIPSIIGLIEGIIYLCTDDHTFQVKHRVRIS